jgi:hypothetical protein
MTVEVQLDHDVRAAGDGEGFRPLGLPLERLLERSWKDDLHRADTLPRRGRPHDRMTTWPDDT